MKEVVFKSEDEVIIWEYTEDGTFVTEKVVRYYPPGPPVEGVELPPLHRSAFEADLEIKVVRIGPAK